MYVLIVPVKNGDEEPRAIPKTLSTSRERSISTPNVLYTPVNNEVSYISLCED